MTQSYNGLIRRKSIADPYIYAAEISVNIPATSWIIQNHNLWKKTINSLISHIFKQKWVKSDLDKLICSANVWFRIKYNSYYWLSNLEDTSAFIETFSNQLRKCLLHRSAGRIFSTKFVWISKAETLSKQYMRFCQKIE